MKCKNPHVRAPADTRAHPPSPRRGGERMNCVLVNCSFVYIARVHEVYVYVRARSSSSSSSSSIARLHSRSCSPARPVYRDARVIRVRIRVCAYITDGSIGGIAGTNAIHTARQMRSSSFRRVRVKGCPNNIPFTESALPLPPRSSSPRTHQCVLYIYYSHARTYIYIIYIYIYIYIHKIYHALYTPVGSPARRHPPLIFHSWAFQ